MGRSITVPNLISIFRLVLVPIAIDAILSGHFALAFWVFLVAGISDGIDGFIARAFDQKSELGAYLDPLADKLLLVSIFVTMAVIGALPVWLAILVLSRDVLIVGGVILSWVLDRRLPIQPKMVSKANTMAQIGFAALVLGTKAFDFVPGPLWTTGIVLVVALTVVSGTAYVVEWLRVMSSEPGDPGRAD
ncbi:MAG: CDP-alcohol phosphatidyltransferase family protein [Siculibacillus sp.]|nr:CDP-alcohol phosphatidyltransferase family protein [Siculibacillus sp.]